MANTIDTMAPEVLMRKIIDGTLEEFEDDSVVALQTYKLRQHEGLKTVKLDNIDMIRTDATNDLSLSGIYQGCNNLEEVYIPRLVRLRGESMFRSVGSNSQDLTVVVLPAVTNIWSSFCFAQGRWGAIDLGENLAGTFRSRDFFSGTYYDVILRSNSVVSLSAIEQYAIAINENTKFYVPSALISSYQSATNWSTLDPTIFHAIEGSQYEHYYANGVPIVGG